MPVADLDALASKYGIAPGETDAANLAAKNPEDQAQFLKDLDAQYQRRAAPTSSRELDSQGGNYDNSGSLTEQGRAAVTKKGVDPSGYYGGTNTTPVPGQQQPSQYLLDLLKTLGTPAATPPPAPAAPPSNRYDPKTGAYRSPYEMAAAEGRLDQFNALIAALYKSDGTMASGWQQVDLYDPSTYHFVLGGAPPSATPPPVSTTIPVPTPPALAPASAGPFGQSAATSSATPTYAGGAFTDPASTFAEQSALTRYGQRVNPPAGSGTALYETFAKTFASMLQAEPFTDGEEAALRAKAMEQVEQLRRNEIEDKKRQLAQRRISDKSGIYISEMNRIDDKYDRLRAQSENELLTTAIGERQRRLTQSFSVLANLAASEEGRMDAALALSQIPLQLQDHAFQRLVTASNLGGDLSGVTNSLMGLLNVATNTRLYNESQRADALAALGQYVGQYFL